MCKAAFHFFSNLGVGTADMHAVVLACCLSTCSTAGFIFIPPATRISAVGFSGVLKPLKGSSWGEICGFSLEKVLSRGGAAVLLHGTDAAVLCPTAMHGFEAAAENLQHPL